jgi:hypothetical protein
MEVLHNLSESLQQLSPLLAIEVVRGAILGREDRENPIRLAFSLWPHITATENAGRRGTDHSGNEAGE